jgi:hypothetical protein
VRGAQRRRRRRQKLHRRGIEHHKQTQLVARAAARLEIGAPDKGKGGA